MANAFAEQGGAVDRSTLNILHYNPTIDAGSRGQMIARFSTFPPPVSIPQAEHDMPHPAAADSCGQLDFSQLGSNISRPVSSNSVQAHPWKEAHPVFPAAMVHPHARRSMSILSIKIPQSTEPISDSHFDPYGFDGRMTPRSLSGSSSSPSPRFWVSEHSDLPTDAAESSLPSNSRLVGWTGPCNGSLLRVPCGLLTPPDTPGFGMVPIPESEITPNHQPHPSACTEFLNFPVARPETPNPPLPFIPTHPLSSAPYSTIAAIPIPIGGSLVRDRHSVPPSPLSTTSTAQSGPRPLQSALSQQLRSSAAHLRSTSSVQRAQICQNPRFTSVTETLSPPDEEYRAVFEGETISLAAFNNAISAGLLPLETVGPQSNLTEPFPSFDTELHPLVANELVEQRSRSSSSSSSYASSLPSGPRESSISSVSNGQQEYLGRAANLSHFIFPITDSTVAETACGDDRIMEGHTAEIQPVTPEVSMASRPRKVAKTQAADDVSVSAASNDAIHPDLLAQGFTSTAPLTASGPTTPGLAPAMPEQRIMMQVAHQPAQQSMSHLTPQGATQQFQLSMAPMAPMALQQSAQVISPYLPAPGTPQTMNSPAYPTATSNMVPNLDIPRPPQNHHTNHSGQLSLRGRKSSLTHDPTKIFGCEHCDRRFRRQEHLKRHVRTVHENAKPFPCPECGKIFGRNDNLKQHMRTHGAQPSSLVEGMNGLPQSAVLPSSAADAHPYGDLDSTLDASLATAGDSQIDLGSTLLMAAKNAGRDNYENSGVSSEESASGAAPSAKKKTRASRAAGNSKKATKRKRDATDVDGAAEGRTLTFDSGPVKTET